jgi:hypothetical protein
VEEILTTAGRMARATALKPDVKDTSPVPAAGGAFIHNGTRSTRALRITHPNTPPASTASTSARTAFDERMLTHYGASP